jgi:signal transduction histidine kinase
MKIIKKNLLIYFVLHSLFLFSQNRKIDSLKSILYNNDKITTKDKATTYMLLVDNYFNTHKDSAEHYIKKTLILTKEDISLVKTYNIALLKYAQLYIVKGDYVKSQEFYDKTWNRIKNNYDYTTYNKYFGDLGVLNFYQGDFKSAQNNFSKALAYAEKENNEEDQLRFLNNTALAMSYLGEGEASLDVHNKAIILAEKLKDSTALGKSFNNIGLIYEDMKAYQKALEFYEQALEIKKNGKSKIDVANSLYNIAGMYKEIGEQEKDTSLYIKAEDFYKQSLDLAKKINYGKILLFNKTGLAQIATARKQYTKAIKLYEDVIVAAQKTNDNQTLRVSYLNLGINYLKIDNQKKFEKYILLSKPLIEKAKNPADEAKLYKHLALLYEQKKQFKKAFEYLKKQHTINKDLSKNSLQSKISEFEVKYESVKKENEIAFQKKQLLEQELAIKNRNLYALLLASALLILAVVFVGIFKRNQFKREQLQKEIDLKDALAKIKIQNRLQEQRLRISRDLHDNIGSQLTFIISSIDNLKYISKDANEKLKSKLTNISSFTGDTIHQLRDTIWAMNKSEITVEDLHSRILSFTEKAKVAFPETEFEISYNIDKNNSFSSLVGINVFRAIQEAINNALKYADTEKIKIQLYTKEKQFVISITDNGKGFDIKTVNLGNGLSNIEKRMSEINGKVGIISKLEKGTEIRLQIPIESI